MKSFGNILVFDDPEQLAEATAERFVLDVQEAITSHGRFRVALAGGTTPKRVYELLASESYASRIEWSHVHLFFGDERCVPPDHPDSNYRMVNEALISRVSIPPENVHRIAGEGDPVISARLYEQELRGFFTGSAWPRFDLVMLGIGEDGHTASLFPGSTAVNETEAWVAANWVEKFGAFRITLTAPAINHAAHIVFLITGEAKARILTEILNGAAERLPARLINPVDGTLEWLVDKAAASLLELPKD